MLVLMCLLFAREDWQSVAMRYVLWVGRRVVLYTDDPLSFPCSPIYPLSNTMLICRAVARLNVPSMRVLSPLQIDSFFGSWSSTGT